MKTTIQISGKQSAQFHLVLVLDIYGNAHRKDASWYLNFPNVHIARKILRKSYAVMKQQAPGDTFITKYGFVYNGAQVILKNESDV